MKAGRHSTVRRRLLRLGTAGLSFPLGLVHAQGPARRARIGWLGTSSPGQEKYNQAFLDRLAGLGFTIGRNLEVEFRSTSNADGSWPALAAEIDRLKCDVLFAPGSERNLRIAKLTSASQPIVIVSNDYDPVQTGHVQSLARPGGRITGVSQLQAELPAKRLEALRELLPRLRRVGVLADAGTTGQLKVSQSAAARLGLELVVHEFVRQPYDIDAAFRTFSSGKAEALVALTSGLFVPMRTQIVSLATRERMPSVFNNAVWIEAGGLMSYGPNFIVSYQRAAEIVARILNGAQPAEMPIEQPNVVEMVLNLKTAKALGLAIPNHVYLRADRVIE